MEKITEINCETGEIIERDETPEETIIREQANRDEIKALKNKESALFKLKKLGLTDDEINAIIG
jgi:hypothetical protein